MMKFDNTSSNIIVEIANKNQMPLDRTMSIVSSYFQSVKDFMQEKEPGVIKMDYFGKFIHSTRLKEHKLKLK